MFRGFGKIQLQNSTYLIRGHNVGLQGPRTETVLACKEGNSNGKSCELRNWIIRLTVVKDGELVRREP